MRDSTRIRRDTHARAVGAAQLWRWMGLCACIFILDGCLALPPVSKPPGPIEAYAVQHGRLAPAAAAVLAPWFVGHEDVVAAIRIQVLSVASSEISRKAGMPAITVIGSTWVVIPGVLDADESVRGRVFSWTQPRGIALWAHEAMHVQQYLADPLSFIWEGFQGICLSILHGEPYAHEYIAYEREAIAFERMVRAELEARKQRRAAR